MIQIVPTLTHTTITMPAELFHSLGIGLKPKVTYTHNNTDYVYITLSNPNYSVFKAFLVSKKVLPL